ncbi:hypothetical protein V8G54_036165 [Vigna mungo]|uniref:Uncharacterized protein n=1 Tax=Vigna mungo TaxID=3915 RepID=A0AAQ3MGS6_VIGMU
MAKKCLPLLLTAIYTDMKREGDISTEDKNCDGDIVGIAVQEVAKAFVSRGDSRVGYEVYVTTVKKGEDNGKKAEYGGNRVTIMARNKVEDARLQFNIQRKQLAQHDDDEEIGWSDQQVLSFLASRMNKSGQGEGLASASMGILEKKQLSKESTILSYRPPPKPPDLNWRMSHGNKHYCTNLEDKVVLQQGVMIGYNMTRFGFCLASVTTLDCTYTPMELYVKIGVEESPPLDKG